MARVNVDSFALDDRRFDLLAQAVRHIRSRQEALGYVISVWHACASRCIKHLRPAELAAHLGYRKPIVQAEDAAMAFCDAAGLGERMPDGTVRIRGTDGRTDYLDSDSDELVERVRACVSEQGPMRRSDIMRALGLQQSQRSSFYAAIKQAITVGSLYEAGGMVAATEEQAQSVQRPVLSTSSRTSRTRSLALAPALALVPENHENARKGALDMSCPGPSSVDESLDDSVPSLDDTPSSTCPDVDESGRTKTDEQDDVSTQSQGFLQVYDPHEPENRPRAERAICEALARAVIGWLNGVHRGAGRQQHHRGFDPLAESSLKSAKLWRRLKLSAEDVIAVCQYRIDGWKAANVDWVNNAKPSTLFRPDKFREALEEWRSGFRPTAVDREEQQPERIRKIPQV